MKTLLIIFSLLIVSFNSFSQLSESEFLLMKQKFYQQKNHLNYKDSLKNAIDTYVCKTSLDTLKFEFQQTKLCLGKFYSHKRTAHILYAFGTFFLTNSLYIPQTNEDNIKTSMYIGGVLIFIGFVVDIYSYEFIKRASLHLGAANFKITYDF